MILPLGNALKIEDEVPDNCDIEVLQVIREFVLFEVVTEVTQHPGIALHSPGRLTFGTVVDFEVLCQFLQGNIVFFRFLPSPVFSSNHHLKILSLRKLKMCDHPVIDL